MSTLKDIEFLIKQTIKNTEWENLVFAAGGYVRDEFLNRPQKDLDIVIDKDNGGILFAEWITKQLGIFKPDSNPVIFPRFGTAKFTIDGHDIESVMPRGEFYTKGSRKPDVFNTSLKEDAFRRDLTINSLFKNISNECILDFTGKGLNDIKNKIIRTPSNTDIIFSDDPLRMMRVIRFSCQLDFKIETDTIMGIIKNCDSLINISFERIRDELDKILLSRHPDKGIHLLCEMGLLKHISMELVNCAGIYQNHYHKHDVFYHTLEVLKNTKPILNQRLMALFHDIAKPVCKTEDETGIHFYDHEEISGNIAEEIMIRLKYPNDIITSVKLGISNHMRLKSGGNNGSSITDKTLRKFKFEMGKDLEDILDLIHADNISHADYFCMPFQIENIRERINSLNIILDKPKLPINGDDLIKIFNLKPGKIFKELLKIIEDNYFENPNLSKDEAIKIIKEKINE